MNLFLQRVVLTTLLIGTVMGGSARAVHARTVVPQRSGPEARVPARPPVQAPLNRYQREAVDRYLARQVTPLDTLRVLAIRVNFADTLIAAEKDSAYFANELKHLSQYFDGASRGHTTVSWRLSSRVYQLPEAMGYYGADALEDTRAVEMMQSVVDSADADEDFSPYDTFMLIHAGVGQETDILANSLDQIYSTFLDRYDIDAAFPDSTVLGIVTGDSVGGEPFYIDNFMVVPERSTQDGQVISTLGVWAFLTGSRVGLLPLFDSTPPEFPDSRGVGDFDLMSNGLFNVNGFIPGFPCAFNRLIAGWVEPVLVEESGSFRLHDINSPSPGDTACLKVPITESEYYLVVNRVHDTNFDSLFTFSDFDSNLIPENTDSLGGAEFDFWLTDLTNPYIVKFDPDYGLNRRYILTGTGVYIWHVDEAVIRQNIAAGFLPNDFVSRKGVDLEEADGIPDLDNSFSGFSFGSHFDSFRAGHNATFGPNTSPASTANSGAHTGLEIRNISAPDSFMTLDVTFAKPYQETRTRWRDRARFQPPTAVDLDGAGGKEIVVFADSGRVYVFDSAGNEFVDTDTNPATVAPYITVPGVVWRGAPAFGDIDGGGDLEMVAFATDGRVFAWKGDGTEVADGDGNPATNGVLYEGMPLAAPPMLMDPDGDGVAWITVTWADGDTLEIGWVDGTGTVVNPALPTMPVRPRVQAQFAAPLASGSLAAGQDLPGVVVVWADTVRSQYGITMFGFDVRTRTLEFPTTGDLERLFPPASGAAIGDFDGDARAEEFAVALPDGRLVLHTLGYGTFTQPSASRRDDWRGASTPPVEPRTTEVVSLRSSNPSAPALGDVDGDGALEIALWDDAFFYLFEHNGRLVTNWPRPQRTSQLGDFPPLSFRARLNEALLSDVDGDGRTDVVLPTTEGTIWAFHGDGSMVDGFPRSAPAAMGATATISDLDGDGSLKLVSLGAVALIGSFDSVSDTVVSVDELVLSVQTLPGSKSVNVGFWGSYRHDLYRTGRVTDQGPLETESALVVPNSYIVYPNPVRGSQVHARVQLNRSAQVSVQVFNLEGEEALSRRFYANASGVVGTPFDEAIDVSRLESGVYLMRLTVAGETLVKTFAILR